MYIVEPAPGDDPYPVKTDEDGFKYFRISFAYQECIRTTEGPPDAWTCSTPSVSALLLNPNGAQSDEININLNNTCTGE